MKLWIVLVMLVFASSAFAADNTGCTTDSHYTPGGDACLQLADARVATGTVANSAPYDTHLATGGRALKTVFAIERCPTDCEPGAANLCESNSAVVGAPNVCQVVGQVTGCGSALVSSIVTRRITKRWVWVEFPADITDADCSSPGVDYTLTFLP